MTSNPVNTNKLLVEEFEKGNEKAFRKLFELFWDSMYLNAKSIVLDEHAAKDIVQVVWTNLWQQRATKKIENFESYIYRAVKYGCYKYLRDNKFKANHIQVVASLELNTKPKIEEQYDLEETQSVIQNSIDALTPRCKQIFRLSRLEDVSNEDIASLLGISKRSVENHMSIALKSIRQNITIISTFLSLLIVL